VIRVERRERCNAASVIIPGRLAHKPCKSSVFTSCQARDYNTQIMPFFAIQTEVSLIFFHITATFLASYKSSRTRVFSALFVVLTNPPSFEKRVGRWRSRRSQGRFKSSFWFKKNRRSSSGPCSGAVLGELLVYIIWGVILGEGKGGGRGVLPGDGDMGVETSFDL